MSNKEIAYLCVSLKTMYNVYIYIYIHTHTVYACTFWVIFFLSWTSYPLQSQTNAIKKDEQSTWTYRISHFFLGSVPCSLFQGYAPLGGCGSNRFGIAEAFGHCQQQSCPLAIMVNSPLTRPYFLVGGGIGGVPLGSHDIINQHTSKQHTKSLGGCRRKKVKYGWLMIGICGM